MLELCWVVHTVERLGQTYHIHGLVVVTYVFDIIREHEFDGRDVIDSAHEFSSTPIVITVENSSESGDFSG